MKTKWIAAFVICAMLTAVNGRADDPNPDAAKAIADIAARRAEKEEARVKQIETWSRNEGREGAWGGGFSGARLVAPGAAVRIFEKK